MDRLTDLRVLFRVVAVLEAAYAAVGLLPTDLIEPVTGWVLNPDGHWVAKLLAVSLATQAWIAWTLRDTPHRRVAGGLAFYQVAAATTDWVLWISLHDEGIFAGTQARVGVVAAIVGHYLLAGLLVAALVRDRADRREVVR